MNRIEKLFFDKKKKGQKVLAGFLTAGDPHLSATLKFVAALEKGGVDLIELGMPFSDPMADGPVIQRADERALKAKTHLKTILGLVQKIRVRSQIPILLMGYYNPIFKFGVKHFVASAKKVGVDGLLIVDLPPDEAKILHQECRRHNLNLIFLLAPTSDESRMKQVGKLASGFIYFVSLTGITGAKLTQSAKIFSLVPKIKKMSKLPVMVGFGIKDAVTAKKLAGVGDGIVVGSALVQIIEKFSPKIAAKKLQAFAHRLSNVILKPAG